MNVTAAVPPHPRSPLTARWRWISLAEVILGTFLVIGHNVFHLVPNEVPFLFVLGLVSFRLRDGGWSAMGLRRPTSWLRAILMALGTAALRIVLGEFVTEPLTARLWPPAATPAHAASIHGNAKAALLALLLVWTFAALGEEIGYRGYLLNRAADLDGRRSKISYVLALLFVSVLFGFGHYYKGPSGVVDSGMAGLVLGAAYLLSRRNLWVPILAHGFIDTFAVIIVFLGWQS